MNVFEKIGGKIWKKQWLENYFDNFSLDHFIKENKFTWSSLFKFLWRWMDGWNGLRGLRYVVLILSNHFIVYLCSKCLKKNILRPQNIGIDLSYLNSSASETWIIPTSATSAVSKLPFILWHFCSNSCTAILFFCHIC